MKKMKGLIIAAAVIGIIGVSIWGIGKATEEYPEIGEVVSYTVNDEDDITLEIEEPTWSPFRGYTIRWQVTTSEDCQNVYRFQEDGPGCDLLELYQDGEWHRLAYTEESVPFNEMVFTVGKGEALSLQGSLVQKYDHYGTRLEPGLYRFALEMKKNDVDVHYLAQEFQVQ